ncbi:MAG: MFS transporter [Nitrosopumilaceae archaeon]|nr:MFS transporter [Nitrosopumilaceae archaeon]
MKLALIFVFITALIIGVSYGMHGPVLPVFAKNDIGANYSELGFIGFANFIPYMFIPLFVGVLLDRFNNGYLLALGAMINSSSIYLLSVAQSVPEIMAFRIMTGIAHAFFWPPCQSIISNISTDKTRVRNLSLFTMFFVIGFMIGPLAGSILLEDVNTTYRVLFQITGFVLATAIISAILVSKRNITNNQENFSFAALKEIRKFPTIVILVIFFTATFGIILSIYPAFLDDSGMSDNDILLIYFVFGISRVVTLVFGGKLSKITSTALVACALTVAGGLLFSVIAETTLEFSVAMLLMGFGFGVFSPLTLGVVLSRTRKAISGKVIGSYETVFGIGWVVGPTIGGPLIESYGNEAAYFVFGIIGIGIAILAGIKRKRLEPKVFS